MCREWPWARGAGQGHPHRQVGAQGWGTHRDGGCTQLGPGALPSLGDTVTRDRQDHVCSPCSLMSVSSPCLHPELSGEGPGAGGQGREGSAERGQPGGGHRGWALGQGAGEGGGSSPPWPEAALRGQRGPAPPLTQGAAWGPGSGPLGDVLVDPVQVGSDTGVDAGPVRVRTAIAPADHPRLQPGAVHLADQRPSRVALRGGLGESVRLQNRAVGAGGGR